MSRFDFIDKDGLIEQLHNLKSSEDYADAGWDGEKAKPIHSKAYSELKEIINSLPDTFYIPEIVPESDGTINLEWFKHKKNATSLGVDGSGKIYYKVNLHTEIPQNLFPIVLDDIKLRLTF